MSEPTRHLDRRVSRARVVVHESGEYENHWTVFLILNSRTSVRINMTAERGYITGELRITDHDYISSSSAIQFWEYEVADNIRVSHFISLIIENDRQFYNMSGGGSGCRWWM
jgi:hypothetical protein